MSAPAGWYDDPQDPARVRYWDGGAWTAHLAPKQAQPAYGQPGYGQSGFAPATPGLPDGTAVASYGARVGAYLIDGLVLIIPELVVAGYPMYRAMRPFFDQISESVRTGQPTPTSNPLNPYAQMDLPWLLLMVLCLAVVTQTYFVLMHGLTGQSVGKKAVGIAVRTPEKAGPPGLFVAFKRVWLQSGIQLCTFVPVLGTLLGMASLLDYIWPLTNPQKQALHDKIAGTVVVRVR